MSGADAAAGFARGSGRRMLERALRGGRLEIRARGVSMRPWLLPGDRVRLERRRPRRGDVALIALPERVVLHRLVRRRGDAWFVRGDARPGCDGWVGSNQILAVATERLRERGARSRWVRLDRPLSRAQGLALSPVLRLLRAVRGARPGRPRARLPGVGRTGGSGGSAIRAADLESRRVPLENR